MSVWADIRRRGIGKEIKKEDKKSIWEFADPVEPIATAPVTFVGSVGQEGLDNIPHNTGRIYYVNDDCSSNGQLFHAGDLIVDDGSTWHCVNHSDWIDNSYIGQ